MTAEFDKAVPPGREGKIKLRIGTKGFQGKIVKTARVFTNDPGARMLLLKVKTQVNPAIFLSKYYVKLFGKEGQEIQQKVEVRAGLDKPLALTPVSFTLVGKASYAIEEVEKGRRFLISFRSESNSPQKYQGYLKLRTNYPEKPGITIRIRGRIAGREG
jgi:hypothetical protein